jgi:glycosyltransferase involved in cell wall biosynthesis
MKVSVILPCQNEEKTIGICIDKIKNALQGERYEIIVSDSSKDKSPEIARSLGARVVKHNMNGYGNAITKGVEEAKGDYLIVGDADDTYDFSQIPRFISELEKGYDIVIGSRFKGKIEKNAMPFSHRYIGTPALNFLLRVLFQKRLSDVNSGFRAVKSSAYKKMKLRTGGMEFASEMFISAVKNKLKIKEIPIDYSRRNGTSKLRTYQDGYRHLRLMLIYSPTFLFIIPGLICLLAGFLILSFMLFGRLILFNILFRVHPSLLGMVLIIFGYQLFLTGIYAKLYITNHLDSEKLKRYFSLRGSVITSLFLISLGLLIYIYVLLKWIFSNFGELNTLNISILATAILVMGIQNFFSGFFISLLEMKKD